MRDSAQTAPPPSALQHTTEQAACHYASKRGFHCYPLKPGTRSAYLTFEKTGRKWGATSDPDMLVRMFRRFRDAELCIVTGELSGIFVLDVDVPKAGRDGRNGPASLLRLVDMHGPLPPTLTARTPSGGTHYFFRWPGYYVKNSVGRIGAVDPTISSGLDIRGDGGMVVAAPSKGRVWVDPDHPIAAAPEWLLDEMQRDFARAKTPRAPGEKRQRGGGTVPRALPAANPEVLAILQQSAGRGLSDAPEDNSSDDMFLKIHLALKAIPPDRIRYDDWFAIGAAVYNELGDTTRYGKSSFDLFNEWSARDKTLCNSGDDGEPRYTRDGCEAKWREIVVYRAVRPARFGKINEIAKRFDPDGEWRQQYYELMGRTGA